MGKHATQILVAVLTALLGISGAVGWHYYQESQRVKIELPDSAWERIFFEPIDKTTELGGLEELRKTSPKGNDIEVRVWRGFGLEPLEGVVLKRSNNRWRAFHLKGDDYDGPQEVYLKELNAPKSGWDTFWENVTEKGLLTLRDPSERNCKDSGFDGTGLVVEINHDKIYRTYQMREGGKCSGVRQMEEIRDVIGEEFDCGQEQCKTNEWFACTKLRKSYRLREREE